MERQLEAAIRAVIRFLDDRQYRYALIGGIALAQWGSCAPHTTPTSRCSSPISITLQSGRQFAQLFLNLPGNKSRTIP